MDYKFQVAVIGGDKRQAYLAECLAEMGYSVIVYGLEQTKEPEGCVTAASLRDALLTSSVIALPIPVATSQQEIFHISNLEDMQVSHLRKYMKPGQFLFGGVISKDLAAYCKKAGIICSDYMKDEGVAVYNTIATAEGAIAEAIKESRENLHGSPCLVLGYGRCGRTLARKLKGIDCETTVYAREKDLRILAETFGHQAISFKGLMDTIGNYKLVFNTIPGLVLTERLLELANPEVIILDIASAPGGVDYMAARQLAINARMHSGLPGRYSPKSSAEMLADHIISNINQ